MVVNFVIYICMATQKAEASICLLRSLRNVLVGVARDLDTNPQPSDSCGREPSRWIGDVSVTRYVEDTVRSNPTGSRFINT